MSVSLKVILYWSIEEIQKMPVWAHSFDFKAPFSNTNTNVYRYKWMIDTFGQNSE